MNEFFRVSSSSKFKIYSPKILNSNNYFAKCNKCGSVYLKKEITNIDLLIEGKGKYPDILLCGHWPLIVVSDKTLNSWKKNNITGFTDYTARLYKTNGEEIILDEVHYHNIIITGRGALDLDNMGINIKNKCKECGSLKYNKETWEFGRPFIQPNSLDGSDLFVFEQFLNTLICNVKVLETIYNDKLTNFSITKMEDTFDYCSNEIDIKRLLSH